LNSTRYVDLRDISEPNKRAFNSLRIVVEEAVVNEAAAVVSDRPELANLLAGAHRIESVEGCKTFWLTWKHYLAYLVTEELVGSNAPNGYADEVYTARFCACTQGHTFSITSCATQGVTFKTFSITSSSASTTSLMLSPTFPRQWKSLQAMEGFPSDMCNFNSSRAV
jgi:hypothetical protein